MKLYENWRTILRKAWSVKFAVLAGVCSGAQMVLPLYVDDIPRMTFAVLTMVAAIGVVIARLVHQDDI